MQDMLSGYLNRYYGDANERLCQTCLKQVERYIAGADGDVVSALRSKLGDWGDMRADGNGRADEGGDGAEQDGGRGVQAGRVFFYLEGCTG